MEEINYLYISLIVFAAVFGAIMLFSKSFTKKLAENAADIITLEQKTNIEEAVRSGFSKQTLTHQITTAEYARMRFSRLDELVKALYNLKEKAQGFLLLPAVKSQEDYQFLGQTFMDSLIAANSALNMAAMYIDDSIRIKTEEFMGECMRALGLATSVYIFHKAMKEDSNREDREERKRTVKDYTDENDKLRSALAKLPDLFNSLRLEYKKHLTEF